MPFTLADEPIPSRLETASFVLRPLVASDVQLDYDAVMASKHDLRPWEQTGWPADDFTVEDDLVDVEMLERRHREGQAFTFTVMNPDESECLGCVYLMPPDAKSLTRPDITALRGEIWDDVGAAIYFWVRTSLRREGFDRVLLKALRSWLVEEWSLGWSVFVVNEEFVEQVELVASAGMTARFRIVEAGKRDYLAYA